MEIRIYDPEMQFLGIIENQRSLIWTRKYFETGNFELHCPITDYNIKLLQMGNLIWIRGAVEAGVIEYLIFEQNNHKCEITCKGRFLESYLDRRLIRPFYNVENKNIVTVMKELVQNVQNTVPIPLLTVGDGCTYDATITFQATYKNLLTYEEKLARQSTCGFRIKPDFTAKTLSFDVYHGLDRSLAQHDRNRVIFAESYGNISTAKHTTNDQKYKSVCYVGGKGEGTERTFVVSGDDTLTGLDRREVFANGSSIMQEDDMTDSQYLDALKQYGMEILENDSKTDSFESTCNASGNFVYKTNYDLGDIVTINKSDWGLIKHQRITELQETYEYGSMTVSPTFGTPLPDSIDWSDSTNG